MNWISIDDEMPPDNEEIWCYDTEEGVTIGQHNRYGWQDVYGDDDGMWDDALYHVTHWRPLPRPDAPKKHCSCGEEMDELGICLALPYQWNA